MSKLNILYFEDDDEDILAVRMKVADIAEIIACNTRDELSRLLESQSFDVILVDWTVRGMIGEHSMAMMQTKQPAVPRIIITGTLDPHAASVACRLGANDYIFKSDLERLPQAITNAVENARRKLEIEERKARDVRNLRLETLGELVGGLSHDLRNVLSIILAGIEIVRPKNGADEQRILDVMTSSVRRAEQMLVQILAFSRGDTGDLHSVATEHVVGEIASLIRAGSMPKNIRVQITTALGTAQIRCSEVEINRALWNLVLNAKIAMMPGGGELVIAAQNASLPDGEYVSIKIKDSGCGIPKEAMSRLFEPFYTTRAGQGGTGLGLSLTKQIIAAHGGKIGVTSDATGTVFEVLLPVSVETNSHSEFDGKSACVLLVEDEPTLLAWGKLRLEAANYRVLAASNSPAAMDLFIQNLDSVSVLVTDIKLQETSGNQLAATLRELKPDLRLIYISGMDVREPYQPVPSAIIEKPYQSVKLLEVLRDVLNP